MQSKWEPTLAESFPSVGIFFVFGGGMCLVGRCFFFSFFFSGVVFDFCAVFSFFSRQFLGLYNEG